MTEEIEQRLFALQDLSYRDFQAKLMPTVPMESIIGVRTPELRKLARDLAKAEGIEVFLNNLPHNYYDENNLHGFVISLGKDYRQTVERVDALLPYVDNWATCDLLSPKVFAKYKEELAGEIERWLSSGATYTIRFGIEMLMSHYLDEDFDLQWPERVSQIRSEEYYVNMMIAWYFATALAKQWGAVIPYIEQKKLSPWVHNKTIQKAIESYRITAEQKEYLRKLKIEK